MLVYALGAWYADRSVAVTAPSARMAGGMLIGSVLVGRFGGPRPASDVVPVVVEFAPK